MGQTGVALILSKASDGSLLVGKDRWELTVLELVMPFAKDELEWFRFPRISAEQ